MAITIQVTRHLSDTVTGRDYKPGDTIPLAAVDGKDGWSPERAARYGKMEYSGVTVTGVVDKR